MRADGQVDMTKLLIVVRNFAKAPKTDNTFQQYLLICSTARNIFYITHPHSKTVFPISALLFE